MRFYSQLCGKLPRALLFSAAVGILALQIIAYAFPPFVPLTLAVWLRAPSDRFEVFYKSTLDEEYNLSDIKSTAIREDDTPTRVEVALPPHNIGFIRIDPATKPAELDIERICLRRAAPARERCWEADEIERDFIARQHITGFALRSKAIHLENIGTDPYVETRPELEPFLRKFSAADPAPRRAAAVIVFLAAFLAAYWIDSPILARLGLPCCGRPAALLASALFSAGFLWSTANVRSITPPLQGPDEFEHLSKLMALETGAVCGPIPPEVTLLQNATAYLPHHPENRWHGLSEAPPPSDAQPQPISSGVCRYHNLYLALPRLLHLINGERVGQTPLLRYLRSTRAAVSFSALCWFLVPLLLAALGRPLWGTPERSPLDIRCAAYLSILYVAFLPQTLWMSSTVGQDYLLIAAGLILGVSVFFRVRLVSDAAIALSLAAAASKVVYLLPFLVLTAAHYTAAFRIWRGTQRTLTACQACIRTAAAVCSTGLGLLAVVPLGKMYCRNAYCYGLDNSGLFSSWADFQGELARMFGEYRVLLLPHSFHRDSAFGNFGWLDAPMPTYLAKLYTVPITWAAALGMISSLILLCGVLSKRPAFARRDVADSILLGGIAIVYWLTAFFSVYVIFHVMVQWCGEGSIFGCAYQRRYELPLYPPLVLGLFTFGILSVSATAASAEDRAKVRTLLFITLLTAQTFAIWHGSRAQLSVLSERYAFVDDDSL